MIFGSSKKTREPYPIGSMYGIFTYIILHLVDFYGKWGKHAIHDPMDMHSNVGTSMLTNSFLDILIQKELHSKNNGQTT